VGRLSLGLQAIGVDAAQALGELDVDRDRLSGSSGATAWSGIWFDRCRASFTLYYCESADEFYPDIPECPEDWQVLRADE
jgi:hypothetical protein